MVIIFGFVLNARFVIQKEKKAWIKINSIFLYLKKNCRNFSLAGRYFLYLGAFTNNYLVIMCSLNFLFCVGASESPKDLIIDAIGLLFIFNLDDVAGELGFVDEEDWPAKALAWIYSQMVATSYPDGDEAKQKELEEL